MLPTHTFLLFLFTWGNKQRPPIIITYIWQRRDSETGREMWGLSTENKEDFRYIQIENCWHREGRGGLTDNRASCEWFVQIWLSLAGLVLEARAKHSGAAVTDHVLTTLGWSPQKLWFRLPGQLQQFVGWTSLVICGLTTVPFYIQITSIW